MRYRAATTMTWERFIVNINGNVLLVALRTGYGRHSEGWMHQSKTPESYGSMMSRLGLQPKGPTGRRRRPESVTTLLVPLTTAS